MNKYLTDEGIIKMPDVNYTWNFKSIGDLLFQKMKTHTDNIVQIDAATGERETFKSLLQRCVRTAMWLRSHNITTEDVVCCCMDKDFNRFVPLIATQFVGAIISCLYENVNVYDAMHIFKTIKPKFIFVKEDKVGVIEEVVSKLDFPVTIIVCGKSEKYTELEECLELKHGEEDFEPTVIENDRKTAFILFSSGTTGEPKPICLNHHSLLVQIFKGTITEDVDMEKIQEEHKRISLPFTTCNFSSLYWISGALTIISITLHGVCMLICQQFDPEELWSLIDKYKIATLFLSAPQIKMMCNSCRPDNVNTTSLLRLITSGSSVSREYFQKLKELLPETDACVLYAQTEVAGGITHFDFTNKQHIKLYTAKPDSCGLPSYGMWYKIVDPETEEILGVNQPGELRLKTDMIMNGYYDSNVRDYLDSDGYLKTGDILYYDEDFCFFFVSRIREIIKFGSIQVSPPVIENQLLMHPAVKDACVIGRPHQIDGEHPMAVILLNEGATVTAEEIQEYIKGKVSDYHYLRGGVLFVTSLPLTPTGKVKRRELKRTVLEMLNKDV